MEMNLPNKSPMSQLHPMLSSLLKAAIDGKKGQTIQSPSKPTANSNETRKKLSPRLQGPKPEQGKSVEIEKIKSNLKQLFLMSVTSPVVPEAMQQEVDSSKRMDTSKKVQLEKKAELYKKVEANKNPETIFSDSQSQKQAQKLFDQVVGDIPKSKQIKQTKQKSKKKPAKKIDSQILAKLTDLTPIQIGGGQVTKWSEQPTGQVKGKFSPAERELLDTAVTKFLQAHNISFEQFCLVYDPEHKKVKTEVKHARFYSALVEILPHRSKQSIYKYIKRNFNNWNRQGSWTNDEEKHLFELVQRYGRKWTIISKHLKRSPDNVYDKYRAMGAEDHQQRVATEWSLRELVQLLKSMQELTNIKFLRSNIEEELQHEHEHDQKDRSQHATTSIYHRTFLFHNIHILHTHIEPEPILTLPLTNFPWSQIKLPSKTAIDCRNKFVQIFNSTFRQREDKQFDLKICQFVLGEGGSVGATEVRWEKWPQYQLKGKDQNQEDMSMIRTDSIAQSINRARNRWMVMRKTLEGRRPCVGNVKEIARKVIIDRKLQLR